MSETRSPEKFKVPVERLYAACRIEELGFTETTEEAGILEEFIGQTRAQRAIEFGLEMMDHGYNIYAAGPPGTGKRAMINQYLRRIAKEKPTPPDWVYVHNFQDPTQPRAIPLSPGKGKAFARDMEELVRTIQRQLQAIFESEEYQRRKESVVKRFEQERSQRIQELERQALREGFAVQFTPAGVIITPVIQGRPITPQEFEVLREDLRREIMEKRSRIEEEVHRVLRELRKIERALQEELQKIDREAVNYALGPVFAEMKERYADYPQILDYLDEVQQDVMANVDVFRSAPQSQPSVPFPMPNPREAVLTRYRVNVFVDNSRLKGAPVVYEPVPSYTNLIGRIEKEMRLGALVTDFTMLKPGALHRANGGYLVLEIEEVLRQPFAYEALKKALKTRRIMLEDLGETLGLFTTRALRPEPIPLNLKVILTGNPLFYYLLYALDEDFQELFKVRADFDTSMDRTPENLRKYAAFVATVARKDGLLHFTPDAVGKIVEYSSRLVEDQKKLSTKFGEIVTILQEADYWARQEGAEVVRGEHVERALEEKRYRSAMIEEKIRELIGRGMILLQTEGKRVGVINGLAVLQLGDYSFGRPNRITVTVSAGRGGVVDIEREVGLGGKIHSKGVMILSGYLQETFATKKPMSLSARIAFEQSYSEIEGDSASSAELYALLSAIGEVPLRQDLAVTGSVNQKGEIQPVGGINEKIEGFFRACQVKGLTGTQGVIIPKQNVDNLMLHKDVVQAVREGKFHIYAVEHIREGIELLTGMPAGERRPDGTYEEDTVFGRIQKRLEVLAEEARKRREREEEHEEEGRRSKG